MAGTERGWDGRSAGCDGVFEQAGEPFRAFGCARGASGGDGARDRDELPPDRRGQSVDPASDQRIEAPYRDVQPAERLRALVALPPMPIERDHITHGHTVPAGSDIRGMRLKLRGRS